MANQLKVFKHSFEVQISHHDGNEKGLKWELTEAINYYLGMRNHLTGKKTSLTRIKVKINGK